MWQANMSERLAAQIDISGADNSHLSRMVCGVKWVNASINFYALDDGNTLCVMLCA